MLTPRIVTGVPKFLRRNIGMTAALQHPSMDPIQELFLKKVREYKDKSSSGNIELPPVLANEKKNDLERVAKQFGVTPGADMTKFPDIKFSEPKIDLESK